ncbi:MAG: DJ-1/PfpI family protein [Treponema sp.]|jgi:4-methyl-5(b-hydroxyethyl)-thiazole monophosphate biosynthesis|nr:DJ-1/PfpI family protein [Treponema sp.]
MTKKTLVLLANGFEDVEALTPIDYLRRAGIDVTTAAITESLTVKSAWGGIQVIAGTTLAEVVKQGTGGLDAVIIPGGSNGAANIAASQEAGKLIKEMAAAGKLVCAICASPAVVLSPLGLLAGRKFTCHPGLEEKVKEGTWSNERVVVDGNIITSRAAGTAGEFAIAIIGKLLDEEAARKIADAVLL